MKALLDRHYRLGAILVLVGLPSIGLADPLGSTFFHAVVVGTICEIVIILIEAGVYASVLPIGFGQSLTISFVANVLSAVGGYYLALPLSGFQITGIAPPVWTLYFSGILLELVVILPTAHFLKIPVRAFPRSWGSSLPRIAGLCVLLNIATMSGSFLVMAEATGM